MTLYYPLSKSFRKYKALMDNGCNDIEKSSNFMRKKLEN